MLTWVSNKNCQKLVKNSQKLANVIKVWPLTEAKFAKEDSFFTKYFLPWGLLLWKKLEIQQTKPTFGMSVLKVVFLVSLIFWFPSFISTKILKEGNLFVKKVPTTTNSALVFPVLGPSCFSD